MTGLLTINRNILPFSLRWRRTSVRIVVGLAVFWSFLLVSTVSAEIAMPTPPKGKHKSKEEPLPPQAVPVSIQISPGATVQIPLRIYGKQYQTVRYILRSAPQFGKVLGIQQMEQEVAVLTYKHTSAMTQDDLVDAFAFVAQDDNGTSAPEKIEIKIADAPAVLSLPKSIDFGNVTLGGTASRMVTIANRGGRTLEGEIMVDAPWKITPTHYQIGRYSEATFLLTFTPTAQQEYNGRLYFPDRQGIEASLHASAVCPVEISPQIVDLVLSGSLERSGSITLQNRTDKAQTVVISGDTRFQLPAQVPLDPGQRLPLMLKLGADDLAGLDETLSLRVGPMVKPVQIRANAIPAIVEITPAALQFGKLATTGSKSLTVQIRNNGGTASKITANVSDPFRIENSQFELAPGAHQELQVSLDAPAVGSLKANLTVHATDGDHEISLIAEVTPPPRKTDRKRLDVVDVSNYTGDDDASAEGPKPTLPPVGPVKIVRTRSTEVQLSWRVPEKSTYVYDVQFRRLQLDDKSRMHVLWSSIPNVSYKQDKGVVTATIAHLPPGLVLTVHVVASDGQQRFSAPSMPVQFALPPKTPFFTLQRVLLALFISILGGALYVKFRLR